MTPAFLLAILASIVYSQQIVFETVLSNTQQVSTSESGPVPSPAVETQVKADADDTMSLGDFIRKVDYGACSAVSAYRIFNLHKNRVCPLLNTSQNATSRSRGTASKSTISAETVTESQPISVDLPETAKVHISNLPNITGSEEATAAKVSSQSSNSPSVTRATVLNSYDSSPIPTATEKVEDILDESFEDWLSHHGTPQEPMNETAQQPSTVEKPIVDGLNNATGTQSKPKETVIPAPKNPIIHPKIQSHQKDRFNFASFDCGAIIKSSNAGAKSATSILSGNKDAYMLNQCNVVQFVVLELCEEILIDTIVLANLELFSSMFKDVRISISNEYPKTRASADENQTNQGWTVLANLLARNVRNEQSFVIPNPVMWTKYVKIEFLTHYGTEFFCPVTLLRVFGKTVMEDLRVDATNANGDVGEGDFVKPPRRKLPTSSGVIEFKSPILEFEKDINAWLENFEFPYSEYSSGGGKNNNNNPPSDDSSKESVLKSILKRLTRLEQNMTLSHAYLSLQHKKLQEIYKHLDTSVHTRVDLFLQKLTEQVVEGMQSITSEYETVLDSWIADLMTIKKQMKHDIVFLKSRVQLLLVMLATLFTGIFLYIFTKIPRIRSILYNLRRSPSELDSDSLIIDNDARKIPRRRRTTDLKIKTNLPPLPVTAAARIPKLDTTPVSTEGVSNSAVPVTRKNSQQGKSTVSKRRNSNRRKRRNSF